MRRVAAAITVLNVEGNSLPASRLVSPAEAQVEVRRSARRRRTVSAYMDEGRLIVLVPARFSRAQEREWVDRMRKRLQSRQERRRPSDDKLAQRARALSNKYLGGFARPDSVAWVSNQNHRWGSCTPSEGTIRISDRIQGMPTWVLDYVLMHELCHLLEPGHGPEFWDLVANYPQTEKARGYLEGFAAAQSLPMSDDDTDQGDFGEAGGEEDEGALEADLA